MSPTLTEAVALLDTKPANWRTDLAALYYGGKINEDEKRYLDIVSADAGGGVAGDYIEELTGDVIAVGPGVVAATLKIVPVVIQVAVSDETTNLTTGDAKVTFRMPHAMTLTGIRASVTTAPTGAKVTVDVNKAGVSILTTKVTIDVSTKTSVGAAIPPVILTSALADDDEITIDLDVIGSVIAGKGLKLTLLGTRTL